MRKLPLGTVLGALALLAACSGAGAPGSRTRAWAEGPVRWLLLPAEQRELRDVRSDAEGHLFVEEFWRRRDPQPELAGNPVREAFESRVEAADRVYGEAELRGSLTDRGRALVLLGPPSLLRHGRRTAPAWRPGRRGAGPMPVRQLVVETWEYGLADLWPELVALLEERGEEGVRLEFLMGTDGTRLIDGEKYLELAAEATVQLVPREPTAAGGA
jgi:GWxTD domain-containing protein